MKNISAQIVILNEDGLVLGVSRKDDWTKFGLPGGKWEVTDVNCYGSPSPKMTAIRETKEETGIDVTNLRLVLAIHKDGFLSYTYLADYKGEINHNEPHLVEWTTFSKLIEGPFGKYNQLVTESLDDMGVKYKL